MSASDGSSSLQEDRWQKPPKKDKAKGWLAHQAVSRSPAFMLAFSEAPKGTVEKKAKVPIVLLALCAVSSSICYSVEFSTFSIFFREYLGGSKVLATLEKHFCHDWVFGDDSESLEEAPQCLYQQPDLSNLKITKPIQRQSKVHTGETYLAKGEYGSISTCNTCLFYSQRKFRRNFPVTDSREEMSIKSKRRDIDSKTK